MNAVLSDSEINLNKNEPVLTYLLEEQESSAVDQVFDELFAIAADQFKIQDNK